MKRTFTLLYLVSISIANGQNVAINSTGAAPVASAMLDITSTTSGLLIPRMTTAQKTAIAAPATGLIVYDTSLSAFYYYNGAAWVPLLSSASGWMLTGNSLAGTEFMGSTNAQPVKFYSSGVEHMRILSTGQVAVNSTTTFGVSTFYSLATGNNDAIDGNSAGTGASVYGQNTSTGTGVEGLASNANGFGTWGINTNATGTGLVGAGNNALSSYLAAGSGGAFSGTSVGAYGLASTAASGTGGLFVGNNSTGSSLAAGSGVAGTGTTFGVYGYGRTVANGIAGGYFANGAGSFVYVGFTNAGIHYKVNGNGNVATIVKNGNNDYVSMFCPESPEILFQDFGSGQLVNGSAHIDLDPDFANNIKVDIKHPLRVIIQLEGDCKGVYVLNKTATGFDVNELQSGGSNAPFTWFVSANRADETDGYGNIVSKNSDARFPLTLGAQILTDNASQTKAAPSPKTQQ